MLTPSHTDHFGYQLGLVGFTRLSNLFRLTPYAVGIHPRYLPRLLLMILSSLVSLPLKLWEQVAYGKQVSQTPIDHAPIFIIGHWRSGTTHLHNLMAQDPNFGYFSMYQSIVPDCSLVGKGWLKPLLTKIVPLKRPMDNMIWPIDAPQEEEGALAKTMATSFYTQCVFPRKALHLFRKYVLLNGASQRSIAEFKQKYYRLLQIATIHTEGKPLIPKNPTNTARVKLLLELFPNAKFIHIHRSPYDVFKSTQNLHQTLLQMTTLQITDPQRAEETVLSIYEDMMQRYLAERPLIPAGNLVEVRFEDLEQNPLAELQRIYTVLNLPTFEQAQPHFQTYLDSQKSYQKNQLQLPDATRRKVEQRWQFAFSTFGYDLLTMSNAPVEESVVGCQGLMQG